MAMMEPDMQTARLVPTHQFLELPRAVWFAVRGLLRREARWYLTQDGNVVARFTGAADHDAFIEWVKATHLDTYDIGYKHGMEVANALHEHREDLEDITGNAGPA
jgi:hypothetical protein